MSVYFYCLCNFLHLELSCLKNLAHYLAVLYSVSYRNLLRNCAKIQSQPAFLLPDRSVNSSDVRFFTLRQLLDLSSSHLTYEINGRWLVRSNCCHVYGHISTFGLELCRLICWQNWWVHIFPLSTRLCLCSWAYVRVRQDMQLLSTGNCPWVECYNMQ